MAGKNNTISSASAETGKQRTAAEMKEWYNKNKDTIENFAKIQEALNMYDPTKTYTTTSNTFSKEKLRTYMRNPTSNVKNLRNLSRFLYHRSLPYRRLIWYSASMINPNAREVIPIIDLVKGNDKNKVLKTYYQTLKVLENMNLSLELIKAYITCWKEDVFFGCSYYDATGYYILPLDPDYCQVTGVFYTGDLSFSMDMSYFNRNQEQLEFWGEPFTSMYRDYQNDTSNGRWQRMLEEKCICLKVNIDDIQYPLPPYMGLFNSLINLSDLEDIQAIADEQHIYKLITATMETNKDGVDSFTVDPDTALKYYNRMVETLPDFVGAALTPIKLDTIEFHEDQATDTNKIQRATETVFNTSGGAQILNSASIDGSTAWAGAIKADTKYAIASLLPQTQAYLNRFLSYQLTNPAKVKMFEVSTYTQDEFQKSLLQSAQYGLPNKISSNTLFGYSELETMSKNFLEEECLHLSEKFKPLQSSHTKGGEEGQGAPTAEETGKALSDEGDKTRENKK